MAPRIVNEVSNVARTNHVTLSAWLVQHLVKLKCHVLWQVHHLVKFKCYFSWQVQRFKCHFSWQVQHLVTF